jgi:REP element-mobilizing transposase RayT
MPYNPQIHHRHSIRLKGYDYSQSGAYFVTLCTHNRECLFGEIVDNEMILNNYGKIVYEEWFVSTKIRNEIQLFENEFVVMPNHIHGIVWINSNFIDVGANGRSPRQRGPGQKSLSSFIAGYKSSVTKRINQIRQTQGTHVWQRNYYEHIICTETELQRIREYIVNNAIKWENDENYLCHTIPKSTTAVPYD